MCCFTNWPPSSHTGLSWCLLCHHSPGKHEVGPAGFTQGYLSSKRNHLVYTFENIVRFLPWARWCWGQSPSLSLFSPHRLSIKLHMELQWWNGEKSTYQFSFKSAGVSQGWTGRRSRLCARTQKQATDGRISSASSSYTFCHLHSLNSEKFCAFICCFFPTLFHGHYRW